MKPEGRKGLRLEKSKSWTVSLGHVGPQRWLMRTHTADRIIKIVRFDAYYINIPIYLEPNKEDRCRVAYYILIGNLGWKASFKLRFRRITEIYVMEHDNDVPAAPGLVRLARPSHFFFFLTLFLLVTTSHGEQHVYRFSFACMS